MIFKIPSDMRHIGDVVQACKDFLRERSLTESSEPTLVLRELLVNAITHGNRDIPNGVVICSIEEVDPFRFKIAVEDQGEGFDYADLDTALPENPRRLGDRGYKLINALADTLQFNEKGNRITAYITTDTPLSGLEVS